MTPQKILIVEDTKRVLDILAFAVGREGYQIIKARDGLTGIFLAKEQMPDLIILDLDSPLSKEISALDTFEVCCDLREEGIAAPILVLIKEEKQKEVMLRAGADDFIIKPFAMQELLGRIQANTWHIGAAPSGKPDILKRLVFGRIIIDLEQIVALKDDEPLDLTQLEFDLLAFLARQPGKVYTRHELLHHVWGYTGFVGDIRAVDVSIRRLREKIEDDPAKPAVIVTRRGCGYLFAI